MCKRVISVVYILLASLHLTIGQPIHERTAVSVFTKSEYAAGTQNWEITRDSFGRVYIANNEGLLVYNGIKWQLFPVPNKTILRSIVFDSDGKLYAGAQNELGYYAADPLGRLTYHSLKKLLPDAFQSFADIWNIEIIENEVFFMATDVLFRYTNEKITAYKPTSNWLSMVKHQNSLIAQDGKNGLLRYRKGVWEPFIPSQKLPPGLIITDIAAYGQDTSLISTTHNGLYLLTGQTLIPFYLHTPVSEKHFTYVDRFNGNIFLVGSYNTGLYKIDRTGNVLDRISTSHGLISNTIRCIYTGRDAVTWIGLDNSIAMIPWNNPIQHFNPPTFNNGSGHGVAVLNDDLYFALTTGLHRLPKDGLEPTALLNGLTWNVTSQGKQIIAGRDDGLWSITNQKPEIISKKTGYWNFKPLEGVSPLKMVSGHYSGITIFNEADGQFNPLENIGNFVESSRYLEVDDNFIWVSHPYHGLFRINLHDKKIKKFTTQNGLPANLENYVFKLRGKIVIATINGIYEIAKNGESVIPARNYQKFFGNKPTRYLKEDASGNIWFVHDKLLGVIDRMGSQTEVKYIPELQNHILSGFENIYPYNAENVIVGSDIGFYIINYKSYREKTYPYFTYLTSVKLIGQKDSIIFGGFNRLKEGQKALHSIPFKFNSIHFSFANSLLMAKPAAEFSYYLEGYSKNWSQWGPQYEKEYTNLPEGKYIFHVKSRFGPSNEFREYTYEFSIKAPWYRTLVAYFLYLAAFGVGLYVLLRAQKRRLQRKEQIRMLAEKQKFEEEQRLLDYHYQLELEKKEKSIIQLKNQNLESELQHKNAELASTALNLLQKKEFLTRIADELNKVYQPIKDLAVATELRKILRSLSPKEKEDEEWQQFSIHFNEVHSNFLFVLKKEFPELSAHDMKLCAYLRMNLSSKEIARLLSISVRGVEISRYRLRKKLRLQQHEDLYQFLFNLKESNS